jgi:hypothetical protein
MSERITLKRDEVSLIEKKRKCEQENSFLKKSRKLIPDCIK